MNRNARFLALTALALFAAAITTAACSSKKSSSSPTGTPTPSTSVVTEGDGSPANFACNGTFQDPPSTGTDVHLLVTTVEQTESGTSNQPGVNVALLSGTGAVANLTTTGAPVLSNGSAISALVVHDNTRVSFLGTSAPGASGPFLDSYNYFYLSPSVGNTASNPTNNTVRMIPASLFSILAGFTDVTPADLTGTYQFAGAIGDCNSQGSQIANATVKLTGASLCGTSTTIPCIVYITGTGLPNTGATESDKNGAFVILGLTPNTPVTVQVFGVTTAGQAATQIGAITINGSAGAISLGSTEPIGPSNPGG